MFMMMFCVRAYASETADLFPLAFLDHCSPVVTSPFLVCLAASLRQTFLFILLSGVVPAAAVVGAKVLGSGSNA